MAYVFISYSHKDKEYAHKLANELKRRGIDAWIDDRIDYGTTWPRVIQESLDACSAFIVIMSSNAYDSEWVQNEVSYAQRKRKAIFPVLLEGDGLISFAAKQYVDVRNGEIPPNSYFETVKKQLGMQVAQALPEDIVWKLPKPSEHIVWEPPKPLDAQQLNDKIVDHILKTINTRSDGEWETGIFRITYYGPVKNLSKKNRLKWLTDPQSYLLSSDLINTDLLSRYDSKTYLENKKDFDILTFKRPVQEDKPSASNLTIPSMEMTRSELIFKFNFRRRLNLELSMSSQTEFTKTDVENFAKRLIDIHKAHHIPISEIKIKVVK